MGLVEGKLNLQFTTLGTKRVLPLNNYNVEQIFKTVPLTTSEYGGILGGYLAIPDRHHSDPVSSAESYIKGPHHSWRYIIYCLDEVDKTSVADELIPYTEPPADPSLTVERVTPIFLSLSDWVGFVQYTNIIPDARVVVIRRQSSLSEHQAQAAFYYVNCYPIASWSHLAKWLYMWKASAAAIKMFKSQLPKPQDPTLTPENVLAELQEVQLWWKYESYRYLDMPYSTHDDLIRCHGDGAQGKSALLNEYLSHHPYPRWGQIVQLLEAREKYWKARAGLAQEVKDKYMTTPPAEKREETLDQTSDEPEKEVKTNKMRLNVDHEIALADLKFGKLLGRGGFGIVFRGKWVSKGLDVALKKVGVPPEACDAKVMAELGEHPNIISFFGYARNYPDTVIVTALALKGSLYDYLHKKKQIPTEQQSLAWAKQVAYAMAYMHRLDLVHRDLKSSNVLFTDDMTAQVCDFGTARSLEGTALASKVSGTYRWMAPEVAKEEPINKKCDVFSFSLVVWELMEHKIPYHHYVADYKVVNAIIGGKRPPISSAWPDYLSALTKQGWSQNPQDRPSFADIVTSLDNKMNFKR